MAIFLALVTLISAGTAFATNLVLGRLVAPEVLPEAPRVAAIRESESRKARAPVMGIDQYLEGIMRRNLFDVTVITTWNPAPVGEPGSGAIKSGLHVKLLGTIVAQPETLSSALIIDNDTKDLPKTYNIGNLLYDRTVVSIERDRVGLQKPDGTTEYLTMSDGVLVSAVEEGPAVEGSEGIAQNGDGKFTVSKELFDKNINDLEALSKMARGLLHRGPDGEYDGFRLSAIRKGSLPDQLGIKNGDIIQSVNGQPLTSMQDAMGAYTAMKGGQNFCFTVSRRGSPSELCYDVR